MPRLSAVEIFGLEERVERLLLIQARRPLPVAGHSALDALEDQGLHRCGLRTAMKR